MIRTISATVALAALGLCECHRMKTEDAPWELCTTSAGVLRTCTGKATAITELQPEDTILQFSAPAEGGPQIILTLRADGTAEYGPAWSEQNFYKAVCSSRRFGDCI